MSQPRFIQLSTLTSYPATLLNRDDSGLAKRMPFGGVTRTRISSQCLKRHWRNAEDAFALKNVDQEVQNSIRSRVTYTKLIKDELVKKGLASELVDAVLLEFQATLYGGKKKKEEDSATKSKEDKATLDRGEVVVLGEPEVRFLLEHAEKICLQAGDDIKQAHKLARDYLKNLKNDINALKYGAGIDAALFGRFVSGDILARISSAVHVAHALTVHEDASETDYFTAVDDLTGDDELGSAHLGATELTSGLFYCYVVVDVPQLVSNLTGTPIDKWLDQDRTVAARIVRHLINLIATISPGAKLGSTAPYDHAKLVLAEAGERQPRTLANAFLKPVAPAGDMLLGAMKQLDGYMAAHEQMYGPGEQRWMASMLSDCELPGAQRLNLVALTEAVENRILQAGR